MKIYLKSFVLFVLILFLSLFAFGALYFLYTQALYAVTKNFEYKLAGIGKTVSSFVDLKEAKGVLELDSEKLEESALYMKYHTPMEEIIEQLDASYLYIFNYGGEEDILYLIDGEKFSSETRSVPNDTEESVQEDLYKGLYNAFRGEDGISPLFYEPDFGYMISGTYPILEGEEKRSFYMTGVDVTLNEIVPTLTLLITKSILLFVVILIVMIYLARIFSDRISKKVIKVKNETLKLSAIESHILDKKGTPKEFLNIVEQITKYAKESSNNINEMKLKSFSILEQQLSTQLKNHFKDSMDFKEETIADNSSFYSNVFAFEGKIFAYSFLSCGDNALDILKSNALKDKLKIFQGSHDFLNEILNSLSVFDESHKLIYKKNDDISIEIKDKKTLVYFNKELKIFSL